MHKWVSLETVNNLNKHLKRAQLLHLAAASASRRILDQLIELVKSPIACTRFWQDRPQFPTRWQRIKGNENLRSSKAPGFETWDMDLLCNAYSNASDNEEEEEESAKQPRPENFTPPNSKRLKPDNPFTHTKTQNPLSGSTQFPALSIEAPVPGRYVSKRERALLGSQPTAPDPNPDALLLTTSPGTLFFPFGNIHKFTFIYLFVET